VVKGLPASLDRLVISQASLSAFAVAITYQQVSVDPVEFELTLQTAEDAAVDGKRGGGCVMWCDVVD